MYRPVLVAPPAVKPISPDEAKTHCRIDDADNDTLIDGLIAAATTHLDGWTGILGRCLVEQTWRQDYDDFWGCLRLPLFPVISVESVKYIDANGAEQAIAALNNYSVQTDGLGTFVRFLTGFTAPSLSQEKPAVSVTYKAGYAVTDDVPDVPDAIKQAMLLMVSHWYNNREASLIGATVTDLPFAVDALLAPYRRIRF